MLNQIKLKDRLPSEEGSYFVEFKHNNFESTAYFNGSRFEINDNHQEIVFWYEKEHATSYEMRLICPKCKTQMKFGNGDSQDPEMCRPHYEFCPHCGFSIDYEEKEPENISDLMDENGLGIEDLLNDITPAGGLA